MQQLNSSKKVNVLGDSNVDMILNLSDKQNLGEPSLFELFNCCIYIELSNFFNILNKASVF